MMNLMQSFQGKKSLRNTLKATGNAISVDSRDKTVVVGEWRVATQAAPQTFQKRVKE
jgi:hypothetical protein